MRRRRSGRLTVADEREQPYPDEGSRVVCRRCAPTPTRPPAPGRRTGRPAAGTTLGCRRCGPAAAGGGSRSRSPGCAQPRRQVHEAADVLVAHVAEDATRHQHVDRHRAVRRRWDASPVTTSTRSSPAARRRPRPGRELRIELHEPGPHGAGAWVVPDPDHVGAPSRAQAQQPDRAPGGARRAPSRGRLLDDPPGATAGASLRRRSCGASAPSAIRSCRPAGPSIGHGTGPGPRRGRRSRARSLQSRRAPEAPVRRAAPGRPRSRCSLAVRAPRRAAPARRRRCRVDRRRPVRTDVTPALNALLGRRPGGRHGAVPGGRPVPYRRCRVRDRSPRRHDRRATAPRWSRPPTAPTHADARGCNVRAALAPPAVAPRHRGQHRDHGPRPHRAGARTRPGATRRAFEGQAGVRRRRSDGRDPRPRDRPRHLRRRRVPRRPQRRIVVRNCTLDHNGRQGVAVVDGWTSRCSGARSSRPAARRSTSSPLRGSAQLGARAGQRGARRHELPARRGRRGRGRGRRVARAQPRHRRAGRQRVRRRPARGAGPGST